MKLIIRKASALDLDRLRKIDQEVIGKRMDRTDQISQAINRDWCYVSTLNSQTMECWTATNMSNMPMIRLLEKLEWVPSDHREELDFEDPELFFFCRRLS